MLKKKKNIIVINVKNPANIGKHGEGTQPNEYTSQNFLKIPTDHNLYLE